MGKIKHRESVLKAISEFDTLGRERFLKQYGFRPSRTYFLLHAGKEYDSKASVKQWLEELGLAVVSKTMEDS